MPVRPQELVPAQVFGVRASLKDHIWYINEQTVLYPAGSHVVVSSLDQKLQRFIPCTERSEGITAVAVSPNRKLVAVAELAPDGEPATATVYDVATLKRKKVLSAAAANLATREFACMAFSADSKGLITQGGAPDWTLLHWHWEKGKLGAASKQSTAPIFQCSFNPYDSSVVCVTGDGVCRFMRVTDQLLKPLPGAMGKREPQGYLCHAWLSEDRVVVATDAGDLLVLEAGELKAALGSAPADGAPIDSIAAYSKGFVCGADDGMVYVYEKSEDGKEFYKRTKSFRVEGNPVRVMSLATSPSEEQLVCSLENAQIFVLPLSNVEILKEEEMNFELLTHSFHGRAITGLDTCVRKPLVATCSMDKSVRIWNYQDMTTDIHKTFNEEVYSVSFHPSGLHVLAGFADKLRLMNVLIDDIRTYKEFAVKACRECQFSNGGQSFAAVNGNSIQIYSSYTCENLGNLRGHSSKVGASPLLPSRPPLTPVASLPSPSRPPYFPNCHHSHCRRPHRRPCRRGSIHLLDEGRQPARLLRHGRRRLRVAATRFQARLGERSQALLLHVRRLHARLAPHLRRRHRPQAQGDRGVEHQPRF